MKKVVMIAGFVFAAISGLWVVGRVTHTIQFLSVPTMSNCPTLKVGDKLLAIKLIKPHRFDFICYYYNNPEAGKEIMIKRLCGMAGDTIEIKGGDLYINGNNADGNLTLMHIYTIAPTELARAKQHEKIANENIFKLANDSIVAFISDKTITENHIKANRLIRPENEKDESISKIFSNNWNADYFGPIVVPEGKYFLLGDNRSNSMDSRYTGFIDEQDFAGTLLGR